MALTFKTGDMFEERAEAIVNTVNCVGVMGKGVALEFKRRWPENFREYKRLCDRHILRPGMVFVHHNSGMFHNDHGRYLINFPTKDHWKARSKIEYIEDGLDAFLVEIERLGIRSVVMPPLGCGNGGLDWADVRPLIIDKLGAIDSVEFIVYTPQGDLNSVGPEKLDRTPRMTFERALLLKAFHDLAPYFDGSLTRITLQKLVYFLQALGVDFGLSFTRNQYGPYSEDLRAAFVAMEKQGLISGFTADARETTVTPAGLSLADDFLKGAQSVKADKLITAVNRLIEGYESPFGLELLSSVHFVAAHEETTGVDTIVDTLGAWSLRKGVQFDRDAVGMAVDRLVEDQLLS